MSEESQDPGDRFPMGKEILKQEIGFQSRAKKARTADLPLLYSSQERYEDEQCEDSQVLSCPASSQSSSLKEDEQFEVGVTAQIGCKVTVKRDTKVEELMLKIEEKMGIAPSYQQLWIGQTQLLNKLSLGFYKVNKDSNIELKGAKQDMKTVKPKVETFKPDDGIELNIRRYPENYKLRVMVKWDSKIEEIKKIIEHRTCLLYTSPSPRDRQKSRMPSSA